MTCEIDGCTERAQSKLTTSGYELCPNHFEQWATKNVFILEERGKVILERATTDPTRRRQ